MLVRQQLDAPSVQFIEGQRGLQAGFFADEVFNRVGLQALVIEIFGRPGCA